MWVRVAAAICATALVAAAALAALLFGYAHWAEDYCLTLDLLPRGEDVSVGTPHMVDPVHWRCDYQPVSSVTTMNAWPLAGTVVAAAAVLAVVVATWRWAVRPSVRTDITRRQT